jgi:hypothetical protein
VLVIPSGGFVPNTASLTTGNPIAAQILVQSPAATVIITMLAVDGSNGNSSGGCSDARLICIYYQNASGTVGFIRGDFAARVIIGIVPKGFGDIEVAFECEDGN